MRPLLYVGAGAYAHLTYPGAVIYEATGAGTARAFDQLFATVSSVSFLTVSWIDLT